MSEVRSQKTGQVLSDFCLLITDVWMFVIVEREWSDRFAGRALLCVHRGYGALALFARERGRAPGPGGWSLL